mmetsp:Transcript_33619/g.85558  ORF Transcript_33619/g.85558 Transcript_33619/m.85558 type:complete len:147 (+) Transcript_33619:814-1254(+)
MHWWTTDMRSSSLSLRPPFGSEASPVKQHTHDSNLVRPPGPSSNSESLPGEERAAEVVALALRLDRCSVNNISCVDPFDTGPSSDDPSEELCDVDADEDHAELEAGDDPGASSAQRPRSRNEQATPCTSATLWKIPARSSNNAASM